MLGGTETSSLLESQTRGIPKAVVGPCGPGRLRPHGSPMNVSARRLALALPLALVAASFLPIAEAWSVPQEHEESPLGQAMEHMKAGMRKTKRGLESGDAAAAIEGMGEFQAQVLAAKLETPPMAAGVPEGERAAFVAAYRVTLLDALRASCDVEQALLEGRMDDAKTLFGEKLRPMEKAGHERFTEDEH